jgi:hypothetical protein
MRYKYKVKMKTILIWVQEYSKIGELPPVDNVSLI